MPSKSTEGAVFLFCRKHRNLVLGVTVLHVSSLAALLIFFASPAHAMQARYVFKGMVQMSDIIIVGRVESVRGSRVVGKRWAKIRVSEVWKGPKVEYVEFLASPRREDWRTRLRGCYDADASDAKQDETVLLFLTREKGLGWVIMDKGRGRMPLRNWNDKQYAPYLDTLPTVEIPDGMGGSITAVELSNVRDSVERILHNQKMK